MRRWKLVALGICALLSVPAGASVQQQPVVAGHSVYGDMDGLDPCIAGIVGVVRLRVMWFNNQVLFERTPDGSSSGSWIYGTQAGAPDPRVAALTPTGEVWSFTDPNGMDWSVAEYNFTAGPDALVHGGDVGYRNGSVVATPPQVEQNPEVRSYYVWVVRVGPTTYGGYDGKDYNFVDLVDTCKFSIPEERAVQHANDTGTWTSDWTGDTTQGQHMAGDGTHAHDVYDINLWVGSEPVLAPPADPDYLGVVQ
jgi:hypothetical protein